MKWNVRFAAVFVATCAVWGVFLVRGDDPKQVSRSSLEYRVSQLESSVADLTARLTKLEKPSRSSSSSAIEPTKQAWRRLRRGMTTDEVRSLLGEPIKVEALDFTGTTTWYYDAHSKLASQVMFDIENYRVKGWTEPGE